MAYSISNGKWIPARHLLYTSELLVAVTARRIRRLIVTEPPRHGKSKLISEYFPPWYLGLLPDHRIILTSYESDFAASWGRKSRDIVEEYGQQLFGIRVRQGSSAVNRWDIEGHSGGMNTAGAGASITGKGGNLIIIDDPFKNAEEANSKRQRDKVWDWYQSTLYTRLEPDGVLVIVQTRWHEDDLVGRLLNPEYGEVEPWVVINLPAIAEENDQLGRKQGEALWPERYSVEELARIRNTVGSYWWNALYQQRPSPPEGSIIHRNWWKYYTQAPENFDEVIQSWDCAFKDSTESSYVVGQVWGRKGADKYLLDQFRARVDFITTMQAIKNMSAKWPQARLKLIEDKANGPAIIASLRREIHGIVPVTPQGSKEARLYAVSPDIEAGNVYLPKGEAWVHDYVEELAAFPSGANDDQCFVEGTMIATVFGDKPIEKVKIGDLVITPFGVRRVIFAGCTGEKEVITRAGLTGTKNHPVFVYEKGFCRLDTLNQALNNDRISLGGVIGWRYRKLLYLMESSTDSWGKESIILASRTQMKAEGMLKDFMLRCGSFVMEKQFQRAMKFIIKTAILLITTLVTWSVYQSANTVNCTNLRIKKNKFSILDVFRKKLKSGIGQRKGESGTGSIGKIPLAELNPKNILANVAAKSFGQKIHDRGFAPIIAVLSGIIATNMKPSKKNALYVGKSSKPREQQDTHGEVQLVAENAGQNLFGVTEKRKVYNLTVQKDHVYYANGLLVSNCDATSQALERLNLRATRQTNYSGKGAR